MSRQWWMFALIPAFYDFNPVIFREESSSKQNQSSSTFRSRFQNCLWLDIDFFSCQSEHRNCELNVGVKRIFQKPCRTWIAVNRGGKFTFFIQKSTNSQLYFLSQPVKSQHRIQLITWWNCKWKKNPHCAVCCCCVGIRTLHFTPTLLHEALKLSCFMIFMRRDHPMKVLHEISQKSPQPLFGINSIDRAC